MRVLLVPLGLFIYVVTDITMNNGSSVHGWLTFLSTLGRSLLRL